MTERKHSMAQEEANAEMRKTFGPRWRANNPHLIGHGTRIEAAITAAERRGLEKAARLTENAWACRSCGAVFDQYDDPHEDENCPKGHASWEHATKPQVASAIRALAGEK